MDLLELGRRIQGIRRDRDLTLHALAEATGVSVSMLSSVERGEKAPTIVVLARIAEGLGVSLAGLVTAPDDQRVIVRRADQQDVSDQPGGWRREILSPVVPGVNFEWIRTTLPGHCDAGTFPAYAAGSHEFIVVDRGSVRLTLEERVVDLGEGDSLYFAADVPHRYANVTGEVCVYYVAAIIMRHRGSYTASARS